MTTRRLALIVLVIAALLALAIATPHPHASVNTHALDAPPHSFIQASIARIRASLVIAAPHAVAARVSGQPDTCVPCVKNLTEHIIEGALNITRAYCANATGHDRRHCEWIKRHPRFFLGALWQKLQPVYQAFLYCSGASQCAIHGNASINGTSVDDSVAQSLDAIVRHAESDLAFYHTNTDSHSYSGWLAFDEAPVMVNTRAGHRARYRSRHHPHSAHYDFSEGGAGSGVRDRLSSKCHNCLVLSTESVLRSEFAWIGLYCLKHGSDPQIKAECEWIKNHLAFSAGYLYARTQPWEVAVGYCVGNGACVLGRAHVTEQPRY